ncbi:hypothetical protein HCH_06502 [Hahella chejuensis KCTC 2396]|uniref:Uncharacterized protein n=1 Tax=Hahella chejuensis (strain KCTC 2396) TaxID=349521 RepID=Q2S881_HAHCH|nr:hypothetical protein [Hahella chejuensis]ABC33143.1 hypothetical protein HCH_06502 [Hahella chejuensis KCTC 2396]
MNATAIVRILCTPLAWVAGVLYGALLALIYYNLRVEWGCDAEMYGGGDCLAEGWDAWPAQVRFVCAGLVSACAVVAATFIAPAWKRGASAAASVAGGGLMYLLLGIYALAGALACGAIAGVIYDALSRRNKAPK